MKIGEFSAKKWPHLFLVKYSDITRPLILVIYLLKRPMATSRKLEKKTSPLQNSAVGVVIYPTARCDDSVARSFRCRRCSSIFVVDGELHGAVWWGVIKSPILQTWAANVAIYDLEWWKYTEKNATLMATRNLDLSPVDMWNIPIIYRKLHACLVLSPIPSIN